MMEQMLPPQAIEIEKAILGAIMIDASCMGEAVAIITGEDYFYYPAHQEVWKACSQLYNLSEPIDSLTVYDKVKQNTNGNPKLSVYELTQICNSIGSSANVEQHSYIVKEQYLRRRLIDICSNIGKKSYNDGDDVFETMDSLVTQIDAIHSDVNRMQYKSFCDMLEDKEAAIRLAYETKQYSTGVKTGLDDIDRITLGFQRSDLIILAARPSMGKTALAIDIARKQAQSGYSIGFFSLEMSTTQLLDRIISAELEIPLEQVRKGGLTQSQWDLFYRAKNAMQEYRLHISDKGGLTINEICATAKNWKLKFGLDAIYIDYLQLVSNRDLAKGSNREQEISSISRRLKQLAKELNVPIIALSQLSRACESRTDKHPMLSDLRESGAIEQDADIVMFPFRPNYYVDTQDERLCEIDFAKNRNGKTGMVEVDFSGEFQRFYNRSFTTTPF